MKIKLAGNVHLWVAIALLVVCVTIWCAGPLLKFGHDNVALFAPQVNRLALITILLAAWGAYNAWRWRCLEGGGGESEKSAPSAKTAAHVRPALLGELKLSWWSAKPKPRFLVIGPRQSGKTSALQHFGLPAAAGHCPDGASGEPRHCQRLATEQADLIDVRGNLFDLTGRADDEALWRDLLRLLLRRSLRSPLQGIVVVLSTADLLLEAGFAESTTARALAMRLRDIGRQCPQRLPVYVLFTKTDLVKGFNEFFDDLDAGACAEPWGFALAAEAAKSDELFTQTLRAKFEALSAGVHRRLVPRLENESDARRRAAIHAFPQAVSALHGRARELLAASFAGVDEPRVPILRGVYFAAAPEPGVRPAETIDPLAQALAIEVDREPESSSALNLRQRSYFLGRFLREVLLADGHWLRTRLRSPRARPWLRPAVTSMAIALLLATLGIWSLNLYQHKVRIQAVQRYMHESAEVTSAPDLAHRLQQLQSLAMALERARTAPTGVLGILALRDPRPAAALERLYRTRLAQLLLPELIAFLEAEIAKGADFESLTAALRVYRMFERPDKMQTAEVVAWFAARAPALLPANGDAHLLLSRQVAALLRLPWPVVHANRTLLERAGDRLQGSPLAETLYARMQQAAATQGPALDLFADHESRQFFTLRAGAAQAQIEPLFTRRGYAQLDLTPGSPWLREALPEAWVWQGLPSSAELKPSMETLSEQLKALYFRDFIATWDAALGSVSILPFANLQQAERMLALGSDPVRSPMVKLLRLGAANTRLNALSSVSQVLKMPAEGGPGALAHQVSQDAASVLETDVDRHFRSLHDSVDDRSAGALAPVLDKLAAAHALLVEINHGGNPERAAFAAVSGRFSGGANAISSLRMSARNLPEPARGWVSALADQSWGVLLEAARRHLNQQWQARVYSLYAGSLKGRYPLAAGVELDASLYDFNQFFKPEGALDLGIEQLLKPFVHTQGRWRNRVVDGRSLAVSGRALQQLQEVKRLQRLLYRNSPEMPQMSLEIKPVAMPEQDARFSLDVAGQTVEYRHGPKFWQRLDWQTVSENPLARVTFEGLNGVVHRRDYAGVWSLFRILAEAEVTDLGQSNHFLATLNARPPGFAPPGARSERQHEIVLEVKTSSTEAPFHPDLFSKIELPEWL